MDDIQTAENAPGGVNRLASDAEIIVQVLKVCSFSAFAEKGGRDIVKTKIVAEAQHVKAEEIEYFGFLVLNLGCDADGHLAWIVAGTERYTSSKVRRLPSGIFRSVASLTLAFPLCKRAALFASITCPKNCVVNQICASFKVGDFKIAKRNKDMFEAVAAMCEKIMEKRTSRLQESWKQMKSERRSKNRCSRRPIATC